MNELSQLSQTDTSYRQVLRRILPNILLSLLVISITLGSIGLVMCIFQKKTEQSGMQLVENYQLKDNVLLIEHRMILETVAAQIQHMKENSRSIADIHLWLHEYSQDMITLNNTCFSDVFAYLSGNFYPGNIWDVPASYDATQREWYKQAIALQGEFYYSDIYTDAETHLPVITISKALDNGDVIGIDIQLQQISQVNAQTLLPEDMAQITFDRTGAVIGHSCDQGGLNCSHTQEYCALLYQEIQKNKAESSVFYWDLYGRRQAIYISVNETGWTTVAQQSADWTNDLSLWILLCLCLVTLLHFGLIVRLVIRNTRMKRATRKSVRIIQALSQTYCEIYLVNLEKNTCETMKAPGDDRTPALHPYTAFLTSIQDTVVEQEGPEELLDYFSLQTIRTLRGHGFKDHSMEFKRRVGAAEEWVYVQLLYDLEELSHNEVILAFQHIDHRKERELRQRELLELSVREAQSASEAKGKFLSSMSHEMRTPLNAIIGFTELAKTKNSPGQLSDFMEKIGRASRQLLRLINNLLDMAKIEQGSMQFFEDTFDLAELVQQTAEVFQPHLQEDGKRLKIQCDLTHPQVQGDSLRIVQIINNLMSNAVKYTEKGDTVSVSLTESRAGHPDCCIYHLTIRDTGLGMSEEFLDKLFLPFEQENTDHQRSVAGTGIGMSIVKSLVQGMNGTIQVNSRLGEGTTFQVSLPLRTVAQAQELPSSSSQEQSLEGRRVLLVEDNEINMEIARELLLLHHCQVDEAWNGRMAVEKFESHEANHYHMILMDIKMPVMNGIEATRTIRSLSRPDASTVPIIALTANAFSDDIATAMEAGMNGHLSKPIDFAKLIDTIKRCLS